MTKKAAVKISEKFEEMKKNFQSCPKNCSKAGWNVFMNLEKLCHLYFVADLERVKGVAKTMIFTP